MFRNAPRAPTLTLAPRGPRVVLMPRALKFRRNRQLAEIKIVRLLCEKKATDDLTVASGDDAADIGVGSGASARMRSERRGLGHQARVFAHIPSCFSSLWNCRCRSLCAASLAAWCFFWSAMISASVRLALQLSA